MEEKKVKIEKDEFKIWTDHAVTRELVSALSKARENINYALIDAQVIMGEDQVRRSARLLGQREGIDLVLNLSFEDISGEEQDVKERDVE